MKTVSFVFELIFMTLVIQSDCDLVIEFSEETSIFTRSVRTPEMNVQGVLHPVNLVSNFGYLPMDRKQGCTSDSYDASAAGKISLVNSEGCSYSDKIRKAKGGNAVGLVIQCLQNIEPGADFKWAALGIAESEGIDLPTFQVSQDEGNFITKQVQANPSVTRLSLMSGDDNLWKDIFDHLAFTILVRGVLTGFFGILFLFALALLFYTFTFKASLTKRSRFRVALQSFSSYILYITLIGCAFGIVYCVLDPFHSVGMLTELQVQTIYVVLIQIPFLATFFVTFSFKSTLEVQPMGVQGVKKHAVMLLQRTALAFILLTIAISAIDLTAAVLRGLYIFTSGFVLFVQIVYLVFPASIILFLIAVNIQAGERENQSIVGSVRRVLHILTMELVLTYLLWMALVTLSLVPQVQRMPQVMISINSLQLLVIGMIHGFHLLYLLEAERIVRQQVKSEAK